MDPTRSSPDKKLLILRDQLKQQAAKGKTKQNKTKHTPHQALWALQEPYQEF